MRFDTHERRLKAADVERCQRLRFAELDVEADEIHVWDSRGVEEAIERDGLDASDRRRFAESIHECFVATRSRVVSLQLVELHEVVRPVRDEEAEEACARPGDTVAIGVVHRIDRDARPAKMRLRKYVLFFSLKSAAPTSRNTPFFRSWNITRTIHSSRNSEWCSGP